MNTTTKQETAALTAPLNAPRHLILTFKEMQRTLYQWHADHIDWPEYLFLEPNFEEMADSVGKAIFCSDSEDDDDTPDDGWMARQDAACGGGA
jgi:hypothetical protein